MKSCPRCKRSLPDTEFSKDVTRPDGLAFYCKTCYKSMRNVKSRPPLITKLSNDELLKELERRGLII